MAQANVNKTWKRKRVIAELLAVFFGPWTWLYTFRKDKLKFIFGLAFASPSLLIIFGMLLYNPQGEDGLAMFIGVLPFLMISVPITIGIWIWAIIDVLLLRKPQWYEEKA